MKILPIICVSLALTACSSYKVPSMSKKQNKQNISIDTPNVAGAICDLAIDNKVYRVKTPESIIIKRSETGQNLNVTCSNPGYETATKSIEPRIGARSWWPVLSGNVYQTGEKSGGAYQYPDQISIDLKPVTVVAKPMAVIEPVAVMSDEQPMMEAPLGNAEINWVEAPVITETEAIQPEMILEPMVKIDDTIDSMNKNITVTPIEVTEPVIDLKPVETAVELETQVPTSFVKQEMVTVMEGIEAPEMPKSQEEFMTAPVLSTPLQDNKYKDISKGNLAVCKAGYC